MLIQLDSSGYTLNAVRWGLTGRLSTVGNLSGCRYVSDSRSRGCEIDPGLVPYFRGD